MVNEQPVISTTLKPKDNPQAPAKIDSCEQYITQTKKTDDVNFPFIGSFSPNGSINLSKHDDDEKGLPRYIFIYMSIIDPANIVLNDTSQTATVRMTVYDSENEQDDAQSRESPDAFTENYYQKINRYTGWDSQERSEKHRFKRLSLILDSRHPTIYNLTLNQIYAIPINSPSMYYVTVRIGPQNFYETVEQEQRTTTVSNNNNNISEIMNILGTIAAYYRVDSMKPWGIIHNGCCGIRKFKKHTVIKLEEFVNVPSTNANLEIISQAVRDLEGFRHFLESNVIDTSLLEALRSQQQQQSQEQQQQRVEIETQQNDKS
nr:3222_t:CDS:2 [Entrophospora candida]